MLHQMYVFRKESHRAFLVILQWFIRMLNTSENGLKIYLKEFEREKNIDLYNKLILL